MRGRHLRSLVFGFVEIVAALVCIALCAFFFSEVHDYLGPEVEFLMGNAGYPCRALPPASGVTPWIVFLFLSLPVVAAAVAFIALAWRNLAGVARRFAPPVALSGTQVFAGFLAGSAIVALAIAADYTYLWSQYADSGPHGQTPKCPPTNGEWHVGQGVLFALAAIAIAGAVLCVVFAHRGRRHAVPDLYMVEEG